jgi:hypothetical protein
MPLFTFILDSFQITQTRSAHTDTDYVIFTLKIGDARPESFTVKPLGNLNNGTYNIGFNSSNNNIPPGTPVVVNYLIINSSMNSNTIAGTLEQISDSLANGPALALPPFTSAVSLVGTRFASQLFPITKPGSCDGLVAAEQNNFTYDELLNYTARAPYFAQVTSHPGTLDISGFCNSKLSAYQVHWNMKHMLAVPDVVGMPVGKAGEPGTAAQALSQASLQWVAQPPLGPNAYVARQDPTGFSPINNPVVLTTQISHP